MVMMFCRACGKEVDEIDSFCKHCGTAQYQTNTISKKRSVGKLLGFGFLWAIGFWFTALFLTGFVVGVMDPKNAHEAGRSAGESFSGLFLVISFFLSGALSYFGVLPGTRNNGG